MLLECVRTGHVYIATDRTSSFHRQAAAQEQTGRRRDRQFVVTLEPPETSAARQSKPVPLINYGAMSPFTYGAAEYEAKKTGGAAAIEIPVSAKPEKAITEADTYWAQFPKEVQALRDIPNRDDRIPVAWGLVERGFAVDAEIMVLGSDPYETMLMREQLGYTWTPAMGQPPIHVLPGLQYPGRASYDPNNPPPGSIPVSLDFAKGLESTSPMYKKYELG